jgi:hypothetical protein
MNRGPYIPKNWVYEVEPTPDNPKGYRPPPRPFYVAEGNHRCFAKSKKTGCQCGRPAMLGKNVCYYHGGKSLSGKDAAPFKHGRYSKALRTDPVVLGFFEQEKADSQVESVADEARLLRAVLQAQIQTGGGSPEMIHDYCLAISRLAERASKIRHANEATISALDYETALTAIFRLVADVYGTADGSWAQFVLRAQGLLKAAAAKATTNALNSPSEPDEEEAEVVITPDGEEWEVPSERNVDPETGEITETSPMSQTSPSEDGWSPDTNPRFKMGPDDPF